MLRLIWILAILAILWSGLWVLAQQGIAHGLRAWLDARVAEGWQAEVARIGTGGFPFRFETRLTGVAFADPETGLAWEVPAMGFSAAAWAPFRVRAVWPPVQILASPFERIEMTSREFAGTLSLVPGTALELDAADMALRDVALTSTRGWTAGLDEGSLVTARLADRPLAHDIRFTARGLTPSAERLRSLDPTGRLPETVERLELDATVGFDAPWDRRAIEDRRPQITDIDLRRSAARWGEMALELAGTLAVDTAGIPEGRITVRATNWRDMLAVARAGGALPVEFADTIERGLEVLAGLSGNPQTIDAPLTFRDGAVFLGPLPLGRAPRLRIR